MCVYVTCIMVQTELCMRCYKPFNEGICKIYHPKTVPRVFVKNITLNRALLHAELFVNTESNLLL